jgi:(p)ppGpp synthase/HD superfamily hydrolase
VKGRKNQQEKVKVLNSNIDGGLIKNRVREKLSWEAKFKEYDSIYRKIVEDREGFNALFK